MSCSKKEMLFAQGGERNYMVFGSEQREESIKNSISSIYYFDPGLSGQSLDLLQLAYSLELYRDQRQNLSSLSDASDFGFA